MQYNKQAENTHVRKLSPMTPLSQSFEAYGIQDLQELLSSLKQPKFRTKQILEWVYKRGANSYEEMSNIPASLRKELTECAPLYIPEIKTKEISIDGTRKYLLCLADGNLIETVGIPSGTGENESKDHNKRLTVCFSTQVGCAMQCAFCATGQQGFTRNLLPGEIAQQLCIVQKDFGIRVSNAVAMGQGEPFLNFDNLVKALELINSDEGLGLGARHITVSTCGITKGIKDFGHIPEQYTLALSLHSAIQSTRDRIMPGCKNISLAKIRDALEDYYSHSHRRISIEYLLIKGVNDSNKDIRALEDFCRGLHVHINLIMLNNVPDSPFKPVSEKTAANISHQLKQFGIETTLRNSRGSDINGACGQLKSAVTHI